MYARPPVLSTAVFPIISSLSAVSTTLLLSPFPSFCLLSPSYHSHLLVLRFLLPLTPFSVLIFSLSTSISLPMTATAIHYLLSICSHVFTFNLTPPHFSHHFKNVIAGFLPFLSFLKFPFSTTVGFTLSSFPLPLFIQSSLSLFPTTLVVFYSTPQAIYYFITHSSFQT